MAKKSKDKGKHGGLEFIGGGKALIGHREQQLEKALERLRMTLGCRTIDEVVTRLERASVHDAAYEDGLNQTGAGKGGEAQTQRPPLVFRMMLTLHHLKKSFYQQTKTFIVET